MSKANKIAASLIMITASIVIVISIIGYMKYKDVQYINQNANKVHVVMGSANDPLTVSPGEYQYIDFNKQDKKRPIEFKKPEESTTYLLDTNDKHVKIKFSDDLDVENVKIQPPNKTVKFNFFKSYKDKAITTIILNKEHKGDVK